MRKALVNNPVIIEFTGLPGSGKTTLVNSILNNEPSYQLAIPQRSNFKAGRNETIFRHFKAFSFFIKHPIISCQLIKYVLSSRQVSANDFRAVVINLLYKFSFYSQLESNVNIMDEGYIHALLSTNSSAKNKSSFLPCLDSLLKNKFVWIVVNLNVDLSLVNERLSNRDGGRHRIHQLGAEKDLEELKKHLNEHLVELNSHGVEVLNIPYGKESFNLESFQKALNEVIASSVK